MSTHKPITPVDPMSPVGSPVGNPFFDQGNLQGYSNTPYPASPNQPQHHGYPGNPVYLTAEQLDARLNQFLAENYEAMTAAVNFTKERTDAVKAETAQIKLETALLDKSMKAIRLDMAMAADDALSQININNGRFTVIGKRGQTITLCDTPYVCLYHIIPDAHYNRDGYFLIQFKDREVHSFPDSYLSKPSKLLPEVGAAAGKPLKTCSNERRIAGLLAQTLAAAAERRPFLYRYGWLEIPGGWLFQMCNGKTHCPKLPTTPEDLPHTMILTELDHGATLRSVEQVVTMFEVFKSPAIAKTLFLWWHTAFLYTLLAECTDSENAAILPMGLCVLCQGKYPRYCMESVFRWYGDPMLSLGDELDQFKRRMGQRKDQPMLIKDDFVSVKNEEVLTQTLSSGSIPPVERNDEPLDLRAAVTLLSEGKTPLSCNPNFISLELTDQDISQDILLKLPALSRFSEDYFRGLARFTQRNLDMLRMLLADMPVCNSAANDLDYELSSNGARVLATLRCVQRFVQEYLNDLAPSEDLARRIQALLSDEDAFLLELLESSYTVNDNLTHVFLGVAQRKLQDGSIRKISLRDIAATGTVPVAEDGIVYFDDKFYYFDIKAFRAICRDCHATTRTVLNSIAPLLEGTPYCDGSAMSRIPGIRRRPRAYQISNKYFKRAFVKSKI